jgi:photosystem II stability/assembly factor-like uncharacterized protein
VHARCRNATIIAGLLLSCSLMFGAWTSLNPGIMGGVFSGVYFLPGQTQVGYACGLGLDTVSHMPAGLVIMTTDGGSNWTRQNPGTQNMLRSIYFTDANTGYACGIAGTVVKTTDGGNNWFMSNTGINAGDQLVYVQFPENGQTGYIGVTAPSQSPHVYKTVDGGGSWTSTPVGGVISATTSCGMGTDNVGVAVGPRGFAYWTIDGFGSGTFTDAQASNSNLAAAAFSPGNSSEAYIVGTDTLLATGVIRYTASSGNPNWDSVNCPVVASFSCVTFATPETAYIGGANGFIGGTYGKHDVWKTTTGVTNAVNAISFPNGPDTGYAAAGPIILKTIDAGSPWQPAVAEGKAPATLLTGIRVVSNPGRCGIALRSDAHVPVTVFDAAGRTVLTATASQGLNLLPIRKAGAYFVRSGEHTVRAIVTE